MNLRVKRRIDYWVGGFLLALLFVPVRVLGLTMRRNHTITPRRGCVVIKLLGAGGLFLATPSMQEIRQRFPAGRFYLVGTPAVIRIARSFGWFDEYWAIDDSSLGRLIVSTIRVAWKMGRCADHLIDLEVHSRFTTVLSVLSMVRNRIGFVDEIVFWRRGFYTHMTFFNVHGPIYVFYDLLAKWFAVDTVSVTAFNKRFRRQVMTARLPPDVLPAVPFVAVGHGCSDLSRERQLRPEEWKRLLRPIVLAGHEIVLLGGPDDAAAAADIIAAVGRGRNLCGKLGVAQSAKVVGRATTYYGIDSMLLHFARALGVPTVSVFGPTDPAILLRPLGLRERVGYLRLPCSPCIHVNETPPCQGVRTCMALALESLLAPPDEAPVGAVPVGTPMGTPMGAITAREERTPPPVGWEVEPGAARVHEVSVSYS